MFKDKRGYHMVKVKHQNLRRVREYFLKYPEALRKECEESLNLSPLTVRNHIKTIQKEIKDNN